MITKSIRGRLLFWLAFLLASILAGFGATAYHLQRITRLNQIDGELGQRVAALTADALNQGLSGGRRPPAFPPRNRGFEPDDSPPPPGGDRLDEPGRPGREEGPDDGPRRTILLSAATQALFNETGSNGFYFIFWSREGDVLKRSANAPAGLTMPKQISMKSVMNIEMRSTFREAFHFTEMRECALAGRDITSDLAAMHHFFLWLAGVGVVVLVLGLGVSGWMVGRALRPVGRISEAAIKISSGNLSQRIGVVETESELGRLAAVLNSTFARLESSFAQQKQFASDASHELRTPIAVLISEAQTSLARERSPEEYREAMTACLATAQKMRQLTEALLQLARMDAGQEVLRRERINLAAIAQDCVNLTRPLAANRNLQIHGDLATAETLCDVTRMAQVVTNLLTNAINYNRDGGKIIVSTRVENGAAVLTVADTGHGIAASDLPRVFERFYRADKSRTGGNTGLGLAISKAIIEAHGGAVEVVSKVGKGSTFTVRLPV